MPIEVRLRSQTPRGSQRFSSARADRRSRTTRLARVSRLRSPSSAQLAFRRHRPPGLDPRIWHRRCETGSVASRGDPDVLQLPLEVPTRGATRVPAAEYLEAVMVQACKMQKE